MNYDIIVENGQVIFIARLTDGLCVRIAKFFKEQSTLGM